MSFICVGILHYRWCVGRLPQHCDVIPFIVTQDYFTAGVTPEQPFRDGDHYYFTVQVIFYFNFLCISLNSASLGRINLAAPSAMDQIMQ